MAELGNRLSYCKGNIKTKQTTLTSISITLHVGILTFDLHRHIVQASIGANSLVSTTWPPTKESIVRDKVLSIGNYIVVLVAVRRSTICTGGISNIVQIFANKNVTLLKIMTRQIKLENDWTVNVFMNIQWKKASRENMICKQLSTWLIFSCSLLVCFWAMLKQCQKKEIFRQMNTLQLPYFLINRVGGYWWVSTKVGEEDDWLRAKVEEADQLVPPVNGWQFYDGGKWSSYSTLECSRELSEPCREIILELRGEAKKRLALCEGSYLPVEGTIIRGRPVSVFLEMSSNQNMLSSSLSSLKHNWTTSFCHVEMKENKVSA